jgi:hypothetical protein
VKHRYLSIFLAAVVSLLLLCSCSKPQDTGKDLSDYIGDYSYTDPAVCMVFEPVEDEFDDNGNPYYGIQYRVITDLDGLLASGETLLLYFYSSMDSRSGAMTAAVEDVAQAYNGKLHVIMLDAMEYRAMIEKYDINAVPEFVLIKAGQADSVFGSSSYDYWTINDVVLWLQSNGVT